MYTHAERYSLSLRKYLIPSRKRRLSCWAMQLKSETPRTIFFATAGTYGGVRSRLVTVAAGTSTPTGPPARCFFFFCSVRPGVVAEGSGLDHPGAVPGHEHGDGLRQGCGVGGRITTTTHWMLLVVVIVESVPPSLGGHVRQNRHGRIVGAAKDGPSKPSRANNARDFTVGKWTSSQEEETNENARL
jgi:hypothetical protein